MSLNEEQVWLPGARSLRFFFFRQFWHLFALLILIPLAWFFSAPATGEGSWLGVEGF